MLISFVVPRPESRRARMGAQRLGAQLALLRTATLVEASIHVRRLHDDDEGKRRSAASCRRAA